MSAPRRPFRRRPILGTFGMGCVFLFVGCGAHGRTLPRDDSQVLRRQMLEVYPEGCGTVGELERELSVSLVGPDAETPPKLQVSGFGLPDGTVGRLRTAFGRYAAELWDCMDPERPGTEAAFQLGAEGKIRCMQSCSVPPAQTACLKSTMEHALLDVSHDGVEVIRVRFAGVRGASTHSSAERIQRVVHANVGQVRACYNRMRKGWPQLSGRVRLDLAIAGDGRVRGVSALEGTLDNRPTRCCIAQAAKDWRFAALEGGPEVRVTYSYVLQQWGDRSGQPAPADEVLPSPESRAAQARARARAVYWERYGRACELAGAQTPAAAPDGKLPRVSTRARKSIAARYAQQVRACYDAALEGWPDLHGAVALELEVSSGGEVTSSQITGLTLEVPTVACCIREAARGWEFPRGKADSRRATFKFNLVP